MSVVVKPSARTTFTPRELTTAYRDFTENGPQYANAQSGLEASAYRFGTRARRLQGGRNQRSVAHSPNVTG
jgi:hypothetical protein